MSYFSAKSQILADSKQLFIFEYFPFPIFPYYSEFANKRLLQIFFLHSYELTYIQMPKWKFAIQF